jgi:hypothetical protein
MYSNQFPHFCIISSLLSPTDQAIIIQKNIDYCVSLWSLLRYPSAPILRNIIIQLISHLDVYQQLYLTSSLKSCQTFSFSPPRRTASPSIISQVTHTEKTIDPYLKSLQENYYYPLSSEMTSTDMQIEQNETTDKTIAPSLGGRTTIMLNNRKITVEDSVDAISDLIVEIQATDRIQIPTPTPPLSSSSSSTSTALVSTSVPRLPICFSLARQKHTGSSSTNFLPLLQKFFHALLSTKAVAILPVCGDSRASPMKTTSEINDLHATSARIFFKAAKSNGSLARGFHVSSSLPFEELSTHGAIANWLTLQGYYLVLCDCHTSDMVRIGFLS